MSKGADGTAKTQKGDSRSKTASPDEGGRTAKGFERVPGPGPKDAGKGAAGPEAKERLDRNH
jgi:hypothetical protein